MARLCEFCNRYVHEPDCAYYRPKVSTRSGGTVYFIQEGGPGGPIKIGHTSRRCAERHTALQTGNPRRLEILAEAGGTQEDESTLHRYFAEHGAWLRGEWFAPVRLLRELIDALHEGTSLRSWLDCIDDPPDPS